MAHRTSQVLILTINPGSTSSKIAIFRGRKQVAQQTLLHSAADLQKFETIWQQFDIRAQAIQNFLKEEHYLGKEFTGVVGRGGLLKPLRSGTYLVNESMILDAKAGVQGQHIANLGCALADHFARLLNCKAYVVDPVSVDEFEPIARFSGHPLIERRTLSHALNIRAATFSIAGVLGIDALHSNMVVAHLGGGISIAAVKNSRIIDVNDASSDGPFSPNRTGGLPLQPFIDLCFSSKYSIREIRNLVAGNGGLFAYLGTTDVPEIEQRIDNGDELSRHVFAAMAYQISKEIGAMAAVLGGKLDAIVFTGGLSHSQRLIDLVRSHIQFLAPVHVLAGEMEMEAMADGLLRVLEGIESLQVY
ncbi:MAG TPA: butyrate kinase [bacterium]|jgi:butyrate kinase|nr:butyrate kinase [bacterium]HNT66047.1 butyrate kinase [bacterium]